MRVLWYLFGPGKRTEDGVGKFTSRSGITQTEGFESGARTKTRWVFDRWRAVRFPGPAANTKILPSLGVFLYLLLDLG